MTKLEPSKRSRSRDNYRDKRRSPKRDDKKMSDPVLPEKEKLEKLEKVHKQTHQ